MDRRAKQILCEIAVIYAAALVINYVWEMLQMPFYRDMPFDALHSYLFCLWASFGDANITVGIFLLGRLLFGSWRWAAELSWAKVLYLAAAGAGVAIAIELHALAADRWAYSPLMPLLPGLGVGLVPVVQMVVLPFAGMRAALGILGRRAPSS